MTRSLAFVTLNALLALLSPMTILVALETRAGLLGAVRRLVVAVAPIAVVSIAVVSGAVIRLREFGSG